MDALDRTLRGDYESQRDGLVARQEQMERDIAKILAVLFVDSTGKKGLLSTVDALVTGKMDVVERRKSMASIVIAVITSTALVLTNLDKVGDFWIRVFGKAEPTKLERIENRGRHPHVGTRVIPRRVIEYPSSSDSSESQ